MCISAGVDYSRCVSVTIQYSPALISYYTLCSFKEGVGSVRCDERHVEKMYVTHES